MIFELLMCVYKVPDSLSFSCSYDNVEVFDGKLDTDPGLGRFCGSKVVPDTTTYPIATYTLKSIYSNMYIQRCN